MEKDIVERLQNVADGELFGLVGSEGAISELCLEAIAEITRLRGDPSKDKSFGKFDTVAPVLTADKEGNFKINLRGREDGPFSVGRGQVLEARWADGQVELVRRARV